MGWFSDDSDQANAYDQVTQRPHEASWSHELIAGAAAFEAAKAYENHVAENGRPDSHATAKELLAGFAGAFLDREVETKGFDWYDRQRAQEQGELSIPSSNYSNITLLYIIMGWFSDDSDQAQAYNQVNGQPHEASWTHELIAGAAAYEASEAYEKHVAENGQPEDHAKAKEILAGITGAIVDREFETRGLDFIDRERAKYHAQEQAEDGLAQQGYY
ncbi:unnamed protein product [Rhizoctonia solani]|uniref:Uncharacterized protein n=1 Tax=Rhizoctonia solani TaxID=456999 RepID=A0A8H3E6M2_9AGAM|nr:unnamed protein product [Rhizoctonia solani]CAE7189601.1 unnamed protein product [Rhizoctonia solani]